MREIEETKRFVIYVPTKDYYLLSAVLRSKRTNVSEFLRGVVKSYLSKNLKGKDEAEARILAGKIQRPNPTPKNRTLEESWIRNNRGSSSNARLT